MDFGNFQLVILTTDALLYLLVLCVIAGLMSPSCTRAIADWHAGTAGEAA